MYFNKIRVIRKEKGITLEKLAQMAGISTGYLSHLENGTRKNPSVLVMNKLADALNKSVMEVFFE